MKPVVPRENRMIFAIDWAGEVLLNRSSDEGGMLLKIKLTNAYSMTESTMRTVGPATSSMPAIFRPSCFFGCLLAGFITFPYDYSFLL